MSLYESVIILRQSLSDDEVGKFVEKYKGALEKNGASVSNIDQWGKKRLAYEILKEKKGNYILFDFQGDGPAVDEVERICRVDESVLRHMAVKLTKRDLAQRELIAKKQAAAKAARPPEVAAPEVVAELVNADASEVKADTPEVKAAVSEVTSEVTTEPAKADALEASSTEKSDD